MKQYVVPIVAGLMAFAAIAKVHARCISPLPTYSIQFTVQACEKIQTGQIVSMEIKEANKVGDQEIPWLESIVNGQSVLRAHSSAMDADCLERVGQEGTAHVYFRCCDGGGECSDGATADLESIVWKND